MKNALNQQQREAVEHKEGPLLILAGAGAGKTRVITHRILHLIKSGVEPSKILAVTFTNKAAKEMGERVRTLLREDKDLNRPISERARPYVSTFHSLGVHILRENSRLLELSRHFTIYDRSDSLRAVKEATKEAGYDPQQFEPRRLLGTISKQKGDALSRSEYEALHHDEYYPSLVSEVWGKYENILKREKALDFDDLLLKTVMLLKSNSDVLKKYHDAWHYIHIDEYQDTNKVQNDLAELLSSQLKNICVVGDIDQTIYTWRGANISNLLHFEKMFPNTHTVILEENYRSTKNIIEASNTIIKKNVHRRDKHLFTNNAVGEKLSLYSAYDEIDEATFVAGKSKELIKGGVIPKDIAVLYRANFQSRILEEMFLEKNIPYQVLGVRFFDRKEVKDVLSFVRYALNPESVTDLKRIVNVPPRGIGKVTLTRMVLGKENECTPAVQNKIKTFRELLESIRKMALVKPPSEVLHYIAKASGLEDSLSSGTEDEQERLGNIKELVTLAKKYDRLIHEGVETPYQEAIEQLLTDAALAVDQDELREEKNGVKLMTVHASKGLEFDYVFIVGLEDGLFPHESLSGERDERNDNEEERRLFYVALTRARKKVFLTYASVRTIYGSKAVCVPSEFITDIDEDIIESENPPETREKVIYLDLDNL